MTKLVFPVILICVVYVADSFRIDSNEEILGCEDVGGNQDCSHKKRICTNKPDKKSEYVCGPCIEGYREDTDTTLCIEIFGCRDEGGDEDCSDKKRICTNKPDKKSEYVCGPCIEGYREDTDTKLCIEIIHECKYTDCTGKNTKCAANGIYYNCECLEGFRPKDEAKKGLKDADCIEIIHECKDTDCTGKNTECVAYGNKYTCECIEGFRPEDEAKRGQKNAECIEIIHECKDTDCIGKNTECVANDNGYICECVEGFRPKDEDKKGRKNAECIEDIYECKPYDCTGQNTECEANGKEYTCECKEGFVPKDEAKKGQWDAECIEDIYECKPYDCTGQNTECEANGKEYTCECKEGFKPKDEAKKGQWDAECIEDIYECKPYDCTGQNTECEANGKEYTCECKEGFKPKDDAKKGQWDAECIEDIYECKPYDCTGKNTECEANGKEYTCECKEGFKPKDEAKKGQKNAECIAICDEDRNDCVNGAKCIPLGNQRFCNCLKGTYGDKCQYMGDCNERYNLKCNYKNGEICAYNTTSEESECLCLESGLHYDTEQRMCRKTCMVGNHDCRNNATCERVSNYGFCECYPGTSGHECEIVEGCDLINCNNTGARCEYNRFFRKAECVCDDGLKYDESISLCRETCNKNRDDCRNGAHCNYIGSYYFCECLPGISGHRCEKVEDEREHSPLLLIILCITSGFLLLSTITLVTVFIKFRSGRNKK
ncbi:fibropellin-1-like isoform X2 [Parasteatoda tepidariorum]|uniref:fibropellin-1-like isoform X2 n=1 Tax=Parasteatoda tepidariorum TaxID=114398 RepID=UPI0039BD3805